MSDSNQSKVTAPSLQGRAGGESFLNREGGGRVFIHNASLAFGGKSWFSGLNLTVEAGQVIGITGESGCGKTSLLRAILGFVALTSGTIEVCGLPLDIHHINDIRRRTAYVPQELQPAAEAGRDLLRLTHELEHNRAQASAEACSRLMSTLALDDSLLDLSAPKLSGGQRQRLLLAAALALPKPLLLLDEPSSALDEESTHRVALALQHACHEDGRAVLVVSHDPVLLSFCDKVITLS